MFERSWNQGKQQVKTAQGAHAAHGIFCLYKVLSSLLRTTKRTTPPETWAAMGSKSQAGWLDGW